ncbi:MAG TPA: hypothetical protein VG734_06665 [Lacunisphaera sp.]|nr:hypothetical protein [Lacunisphaera sp.]
MRRKLSVACLLLAWLCANGAVWNVVQAVGWARMFRDYSRVMPAAQALKVTFDGSAACKFCEMAEEGREASRETQSPASVGNASDKILLIAESVPAPVLVAPELSWPGVADDAGLTRTESVPVPPPRV